VHGDEEIGRIKWELRFSGDFEVENVFCFSRRLLSISMPISASSFDETECSCDVSALKESEGLNAEDASLVLGLIANAVAIFFLSSSAVLIEP
jgi:hypothetical protein